MRWKYVLVKDALIGSKDSEIGYLYGESNNVNLINKPNKRKIAGFDLDQTLINTKSERRFPKDFDDWKWAHDNVKDKLKEFNDKNFEIIIVTNQAGIKKSDIKTNEFKIKIDNIEKDLIATYPNIFFCGDGAGREKDHTSADIKFAYNCAIDFITPERLFIGDTTSIGKIEYPISQLDPALFDPKTKFKYIKNKNDKPELILMVGLPASGKSFIANNIVQIYENDGAAIDCISLDKLKTKPKMLKSIQSSAISGNTIIVDNTNLDLATRTSLIKFVKGINNNYFVRILWVNTSFDRSLHNNFYRYFVNYKDDVLLIPEFVYKMMIKKFTEPSTKENNLIDIVQTVNLLCYSNTLNTLFITGH
nr:bifunctional polynucleotide phosphatase/kinase-like [Hydra vulgaris]